jgi:asparagine synthase (glutamine-hydrolysing)
VLASTSIATLLESLGTAPRVDSAALATYLTCNACLDGATMLEGIRAVRPGAAMQIDSGGAEEVALTRFSFAPDESDAGDPVELRAWGWQVLCEGIRRFAGDGTAPLGVMLSGGVDSALVLAAAVEASPGAVIAYTIDFGDAGSASEVEGAQWVAKRLGVRWERIRLDCDGFVRLLPGLLHGYDSPATSAMGPFAAMARAALDGVQVVLTGQGADSVFGLESVWYRLDRLEQRTGLRALSPHRAGALANLAFRVGARLGWRDSAIRPLRGLHQYARWRAGRLLWYGSTLEEEQALDLLAPELRAQAARERRPHDAYVEMFADCRSRWISDMLTRGVMYTHIAEQAVRAFTNAGDALGMTIKHPYLNKRLTDRTFHLPRSIKERVAPGKRIVRELCDEKLGPEVSRRPKANLNFPLADWLRGPLRHVVDAVCDAEVVRQRGLLSPEAVSRLRARFDAGSLPWADLLPIVFLELWLRIHVDGAGRVSDVRELL